MSTTTKVDVHGLISKIEKDSEEYLATRPEATLIVGLSASGERHIRSFRSPEAQHAPLPQADSIYEIGSISKVYTTSLLAVLEDEGVISLEDPISKHLPKLALPPDVAKITIRQLATHTSGLGHVGKKHQKLVAEESIAREPPFGAYTHYLRYRKELLYEDLEAAELAYPTGQGWEYSIIGMGTLGHILELAAGKPYEPLLKELVCEPLGLKDTGYTLSEDQLKRMIRAYDAEGQPTPNWYHDVLLPQGGLRSTMDDMLTFAEANLKTSLENDGSNLSKALRRTRERHAEWPAEFEIPERFDYGNFIQGLGWRGFDLSKGIAWCHGGVTLFYVSAIGVHENAQVGLVVMSTYRKNLGDFTTLPKLHRKWLTLVCE